MKRIILIGILLIVFSGCAHPKTVKNAVTEGVHHVGLSVKNLEQTSDFFVEVLNFKVVHEKPDYPAKFISDGTVMITLWQVDKSFPHVDFNRKNNIGLHHLALKVGSFEKLEELFQKLKKWPGVKVQFSPELMAGGPAKHSIFYEPGGIRLELTHSPR